MGANFNLKLSILIDFRPSNVRKCPNVAIHLYPGPRYDSILLHFAGDSTITKVVEDDEDADDEFVFARLDIMLCVVCCILYELLVMLYGIELNVYVFIIIILILIISILK
jgi:hypothetical protein